MQKNKYNVVILIPCLKPDYKFTNLVNDLIDNDFNDIIVVNDGSSEAYDKYFDLVKDKVVLLKHTVNLGKGRALKTGFNEYLNHYEDKLGVITVDADGQHQLEDIIKVAEEMEKHPKGLILGSRDFSSKNVPKKNRMGNVITRNVFNFFTGIKIQDTQTGLRGITNDFMRYLMNVQGERFEFEMNMLVVCKERNIKIYEVPINTIYLEGNKSSHFNPLHDSIKVYTIFIKFAISSMISITVDWIIFYFMVNFIINGINDSSVMIFLGTVIARIVSCSVNYCINRKRVFSRGNRHSVNKFIISSSLILLASACLTSLFYAITKFDMTLLKMIADFLLFFVNFRIQREWVFKNSESVKE